MMIKRYTKNLVKSFGYATSDMVRKSAPNIVDTMDTVSMSVSDATRFFRDQRTNMNRTTNLFDREALFKSSNKILKDAKADIKSGKFYANYRDDSLVEGSDIDWDDVDDTFSDIEDPDIKESKTSTLRSKISSHENRQNAELISHTMTSSIKALMDQNKANSTLAYTQNIANFDILNKNMDVLNTNIGNRLANIQAAAKAQLDNAASYYAESIDLQKQQVELLKKIAPDESPYGRSGGKDSIVNSVGMLNMSAYKTHIKRNFDDNVFDTSEIETIKVLLKSLKDLSAGNSRTVMNPMGFVPSLIMKTLVPSQLKKDVKDIDSMFENITDVMLRRLNKMGRGGGFGGLLGSILGVDNSIDRKYNSTKYNKGRVSWDGKSKKALEEVIPGYLAEISATLTNSTAKMYDYDKGKYVKIDKIAENREDDFIKYSKSAYESVNSDIEKLINSMNVGSEAMTKQLKVMDEVYSYMFENDLLMDKSTISNLKDNKIGNEASYKLIEKALDNRVGMKKYSQRVSDVATLEKTKRRFNTEQKDQDDIYIWEYNKFFDKNAKSGPSKSGNPLLSILDTKDSYNNSVFDYLRMIEKNTHNASEPKVISYRKRDKAKSSQKTTRRRAGFSRQANTKGAAPSSVDDIDDSLIEAIKDLNAEDILNSDWYNDGEFGSLNPLKSLNESVSDSPLSEAIGKGSIVVGKLLDKALVGDDDSNKTFVQHLQDIFDNKDSVMGKFLAETEKSNRSKYSLVNMMNVLLGKGKDKFLASDFGQNAIQLGRDVKARTKESLQYGKEVVGESFYAIGDDIKNRFSRESQLVEAVQKAKPGTIKHYAAGSNGKLSHDQIAVLSKNEAILTPEEYSEYQSLKNKLASEEVIDGLDKQISRLYEIVKIRIPNDKDTAKIGAMNMGNQAFKQMESAATVLGNSLFGIVADDNTSKNAKIFKDVGADLFKTLRTKTDKVLSGGLLGGGASLLLGTVGGPLLGAAAGIGISLAKESEGFKKFLFGDVVTGKKGAVPTNVMDAYYKYFPDIKKYGLPAGIIGALPMTPFGPVGGLMMGSAISFFKNNETARRSLFGEEGLIGTEAAAYIEKHSKKLLTGAAIGALSGAPFGLVGNAILGSTLSVVTTSDEFKKGMIGELDPFTGTYENGILPSIRDTMVIPLKEFALDVPRKTKEFFTEEVGKPLREAMKPLGKLFIDMGAGIKNKIVGVMEKGFNKLVATPMYKKLEEYLLDPLKKLTSKIYNTMMGITKGIITAPVKLISGVGRKVKDSQIRKGKASYMTAGERLNYSTLRGLDYSDDLVKMDQTLQGADMEKLESIKDKLSISDVEEGIRKGEKRQIVKLSSRKIAESSKKIRIADLKLIEKYLGRKFTDEEFMDILRRIGSRRKLTTSEFKRFVVAATQHRAKIHDIYAADGKQFAKNKKELNELFGTDDILSKMSTTDALNYVNKQISTTRRRSVVDGDGNIHEEVSKADMAKADLMETVTAGTPKYREGVLDHLKRISQLIAGTTTGKELFDVEGEIYERRTKDTSRALNDNLREEMGSEADEVDELYEKIMQETYSKNRKQSNVNHTGKTIQHVFMDDILSSVKNVSGFIKYKTGIGSKGFTGDDTVKPETVDDDKVHYEYTEDGPIKYITNTHGGKEIDDSDATTTETLRRRDKRLEATKQAAPVETEDKKGKEDEEPKKKKGLLAKIFGALGLVGGLGKKFIGGGLGKIAGLKMFTSLGIGRGGVGGLLGLILASPLIVKYVLPWVSKNFETKILPFVTEKVIPSTVNVITTLAPYIAKMAVESIKVAVPLLVKGVAELIPNLVSGIFTGKTAGDFMQVATGTEVDAGVYEDENGEIKVDNESIERGYNSKGEYAKHMGSVATRDILTQGARRPTNVVAASRTIGTVGRKAASNSKVIGAISRAGSKFAGKHKILSVTGKLAKASVTMPYKAVQLPGTLLSAGKGNRMAAAKELFTGNRAVEMAEGMGGSKIGEIFKNHKSAQETMAKTVGAAAEGATDSKSMLANIAGKLNKVFESLINSAFFKSKISPEVLERLSAGGLAQISEEFAKAIVDASAKTGSKTAFKAGSKAAAFVASGGAVSIPIAIYDAIDGWRNAAKYLGINADLADEIPSGMKFASSLIKVVSGLFIGTALIPQEVYLNIYMKVLAKIFGEDINDKVVHLRKQSDKERAKKAKTMGQKSINRKEYDKAIKREKRETHPVGRAFNAFTKKLSSIKNDILGMFGAGKGPETTYEKMKEAEQARTGSSYMNSAFWNIPAFGSTTKKVVKKKEPEKTETGEAKPEDTDNAGTGPDRYFSQGDSRWAKNKLKNSTMKDAGCGPTSIAMALSNSTGKNITPDMIANDNKEDLPGYSTWNLFPSVAKKYNLGYNQVKPDKDQLVQNLKKGQVVISGTRRNRPIGQSPYTNTGHIVVAKGIKNGRVEVSDPRGENYNKSYDMDTVLSDMTLGFRYDANPNSASLIGKDSRLNAGGSEEDEKESAKSSESTESSTKDAAAKRKSDSVKLGDKIVSYARSIKDKVTYNYGSDSFTPNKGGTGDCSSFTKHVFKTVANIDLPRSSSGQGTAGKSISINDVKPGDLAAYSGHVGIFTDSSGNVIHNSRPGDNVLEGNYKVAGNNKPVNPRRILGEMDVGEGVTTGSDSGGVSVSSATSGGDPFSTFFGKLGGAFVKGTADLFGLKTEEAVTEAAPTESGENGTQDAGGEGIHMKVNRPDNTGADLLEKYLRKMGAASNMKGSAFKKAQGLTGISPVDLMVWAALESNWGKSRIAKDKNNFFGIGAVDNDPYNRAESWGPEEGVIEGAKWINKNYVRGKYKQDNFWEIFDGPKGSRVHAYSTAGIREAKSLAGMRTKFYNWARSAGSGPEEAYKMAYGDIKSDDDINRLVELENGFGAGEDYAGGSDDFPDTINGFPWYGQRDPRWKSQDSRIFLAGCGPTSFAMGATAALGRRIEPPEVAKKAAAKGLWSGGGGAHNMFDVIAPEYGLTSTRVSRETFMENAAANRVQFILGRNGPIFGNGGHYSAMLGKEGDKFISQNPIKGWCGPKTLAGAEKFWDLKKDGKYVEWTKDGVNIAEGDASEAPTEQEQEQMQGAPPDPFSAFFGKLGGAFTTGMADLFGLKTEEPQAAEGGSSSGALDGAEGTVFKDAICTEFGDSNMAYGKAQGKNACAAHNMTMGTIIYIPDLEGKLGGGKFVAHNGKSYDLGPDKSGRFVVADNGGPFFDFDIWGFKGKTTMDVHVISWGDGPMCWTMTQAIADSKRRGNWASRQNAFKWGLNHGGYKTTKLTKFSTDDINNPLLNPTGNAGGYGSDMSNTVDRFFNKTLGARKSSGFGRRDIAGYGPNHTGNDYDTFGKSSKIKSPVSGVVTRTNRSTIRGRNIGITDIYGNVHNFDHLGSKQVNVGDKVNAMDTIGNVGDSGTSSHGKHLHYEVMDRNKRSMDPADYMKQYGAFGGVENKNIAAVDRSIFDNIDEAVNRAHVQSSGDASGVISQLICKIIGVLENINCNTKTTNTTLNTIIAILSKHYDKLPTEAKEDLSKLNAFTEAFGKMGTANDMAMIDKVSKDSNLVNSDVRELHELMNTLAER